MNNAAKREIEYCARVILDAETSGSPPNFVEVWAARLALAVRESGEYDLGSKHVPQGLTENEIITLEGLRS